jgi:hypothetical protein
MAKASGCTWKSQAHRGGPKEGRQPLSFRNIWGFRELTLPRHKEKREEVRLTFDRGLGG